MNRIFSVTGGSRNIAVVVFIFLTAQMKSCPTTPGERTLAPLIDWEMVREYPHDPEAFTQGLIFREGYFYESTGRRGESDVRKVDPETGEIIRIHPLKDDYFGEGLTAWGDRLIQLTLSSETGFVYDMKTFETVATFRIEGNAWGLTNDDEHLIMSDGSSHLRFLDPDTFLEVHRIRVTENGEPLARLNELEMIDGYIFANLLNDNHIAVIDPGTGEVAGRIDLQDLVDRVREEHSVNVLNGIAYDSQNERLFVTGKLWPRLYEIKIAFPFPDPPAGTARN